MKKFRWLLLIAVFALVAAACGDSGDDTTADTPAATEAPPATDAPEPTEAPDEDLTGRTVTIFGPESSEEEAGSFQDALDVFNARTGINATYTGARDFSDQINAQAVGGNPPDIAIFPQPGKVLDFGAQGLLQAIPSDVADVSYAEWPTAWTDFFTLNGTLWAVPNKSDLKSLVWYLPGSFADKGYEVPETWDALKALADEMIANGDTPWCVGIESGPATGWTFTDWNEDLALRFQGADWYDQWVAHEIPFNTPENQSIWEEILGEWNKEGAVFAAGGSIAATPFGDSGAPLAAGDCMMHRQASFFSAFIPEGTVFGPDGMDVFYFPAVDPATRPVLVAGTGASAFRDAPEVWEVMKFLTSGEYADLRAVKQSERKGGGLSGYLTANTTANLDSWLPLEQSFINILQTGDPARFDASDLMPAAVGAGSFWVEATSAVNGDKSIEDALQAIEDSWPAE